MAFNFQKEETSRGLEEATHIPKHNISSMQPQSAQVGAEEQDGLRADQAGLFRTSSSDAPLAEAEVEQNNREASSDRARLPVEFAMQDQLRVEFALAEQDKMRLDFAELDEDAALIDFTEDATERVDTTEQNKDKLAVDAKELESRRVAPREHDGLPVRFAQRDKDLAEAEVAGGQDAFRTVSSEVTGVCVSVVIGGSSGLGRSLCKLLGSELPAYLKHRGYSHRILAVARSTEALFELAAEVRRGRGEDVVEAVVADVTTSEGIAAVCDAVQSCFQTSSASQAVSYVAHVVYCSAILVSVGQSFAEMSAADLRDSLAVNAEALMHLVGALHQRGLIQLLDETKQLKTKGLWSWTRVERNLPRTRVLVVGSGSAHKPVVGWPSYSISKATLYAITRMMIKEGCLVATVLPGIMDTPLLHRCRADTAARGQQIISMDPARQPRPPVVAAAFMRDLLLDLTDDEFLNNGKEWNIETDCEKVVLRPKPPFRHPFEKNENKNAPKQYRSAANSNVIKRPFNSVKNFLCELFEF